jgi:hypothetical protein
VFLMLPSTLSESGNVATDELKEPGQFTSPALLSRALLPFHHMSDMSCAHVRSCLNVSQIEVLSRRRQLM